MITVIPQHKAKVAENMVRIHEPMPLANPFQSNHRVTNEECGLAYEAWLRHRIATGDALIISELERIARFACDGDVILAGPESTGMVIKRIVEEALNNDD